MPAITIGLVTYNRIAMLREAVRSVLDQSFKDFLLLIGNDYPEVPVTFDVLGIDPDPRIHIINHEKNLGQIANLNYLLNASSSKWFTWLGDDDLFHPEFLRQLHHVAKEHQETDVSAVYCGYFSSALRPEVFQPLDSPVRGELLSSPEFILNYTARKYHLIGCYALLNTEALKAVKGLPQLGNSFSPYCDTLLPILLAEHGDICWVDEPLVFLRTHAESESVSSSDFEGYTTAESDFLRELRRVCSSARVNMREDECVKHIVFWFIFNEWGVLLRTPSLNWFSASRKFILYQFRINLPRLAPGFWLQCFFYSLRVMLRRSTYHAHTWCINSKRRILGTLHVGSHQRLNEIHLK